LSTFIGAWVYPGLGEIFPTAPGEASSAGHTLLQILAMGAAIAGLLLAGWLFIRKRDWLAKQVRDGVGAGLWKLWHHAWGFDALFDRLLVRPWNLMVKWLRVDLVNLMMNLPAVVARVLNSNMVRAQNGRVRSYALVMVLGATVILLALASGGAA
jgi:NADH-quinone oxidoreductase subunit L